MSTSDLRVVTAIDGIWIGSARAYAHGDHVSADAVRANGWEDLVASPETKAGKAAAEA